MTSEATNGPSDNGTGISVSTPQTLEQRSAAAFGMPDPTVDAPGVAPLTGEVPPSAVDSVTPDAAATARAERRAKLDALKTEERGRVDAMAAIRERDELRQRYADLEAKHKSYETRIDPSALTPEKLFALAESMPNLSPVQLGEWLRERMANPEAAAARAASAHVDPKLSALEKRLVDQQATIDAFMSQQETAKADAAEREAATQFFAFTSENSASAPYSSRFLAEHGEEQYLKLAQRAVQDVPAHGGAQAILDEIEENLAQLSRVYAPQGAPQRPRAAPVTNAAAQAPTTVSNSLAQQRSSVVDEDADWANLPFEERSSRLFR